MRWLGLDYGDTRTGVAVSDGLGWTAQGLEVIAGRNTQALLDRVEELARQWEVVGVVVGLPKNMDGTIGRRGEISIEFADKVKARLNIPVELWDERLSSASAERTLLEADMSRKKRKQVIDKMAAALILQNYMDAKSRK